MKRSVLEATLARLESIKDEELRMDKYGFIDEGKATEPGCLAQHIILANVPDVAARGGLGSWQIAETSSELLGVTENDLGRAQLFLTPLHFDEACEYTRQNAINVLRRLLDTGVVDWRPEMKEADRRVKPIEVTLT
jgi:hypothetical protein